MTFAFVILFSTGRVVIDRQTPKPEFMLSQSDLWSLWLENNSQKFEYLKIIDDKKFFGYNFNVLVLEVAGRKMHKNRIVETLADCALVGNYTFDFYIHCKELPDCDIIKILYIPDPLKEEYDKYKKRLEAVKQKYVKSKERINKLFK